MTRAADPILARGAATAIVRRLRDHGHLAYFAGGCVRDGLLGLHPTDYDVATDATPQRVQAIFERTQSVGAAFGVVLVHVPPEVAADTAGDPHTPWITVEVATFRSDGVYSDARRPDSICFSDPESDAQRRDFTINALFLDPLAPSDDAAAIGPKTDLRGRIIDYVGGVADLRARVLRAVGDPHKRLAEDHLRALRAVRFAARLGFTLDPSTAAAIRAHAADLKGVSRERIGEELRRMLAHPARGQALDLLQSLALDAPVLNESPHQAALPVVLGLPHDSGSTTALAAWAIDRHRRLAPDDIVRLIRGWRRSLCLSNDECEQLSGSLSLVDRFLNEFSAASVAQQKRLLANRAYPDAMTILKSLDNRVWLVIGSQRVALESDGVGIHPEPLLTGDDLVAAGFCPGPKFKLLIDRVYDAQLEGAVHNREQALELARELGV